MSREKSLLKCFSNICTNRSGLSANLVDKRVSFFLWKRSGQSEYLHRSIKCHLIHVKIPMRPDPHFSPHSYSYPLTLFPSYPLTPPLGLPPPFSQPPSAHPPSPQFQQGSITRERIRMRSEYRQPAFRRTLRAARTEAECAHDRCDRRQRPSNSKWWCPKSVNSGLRRQLPRVLN